MLSWGTKRIKLRREDVILPAVTRKMEKAVMLWEYIEACRNESIKSISRTSFFEVYNALTARDSKRKALWTTLLAHW